MGSVIAIMANAVSQIAKRWIDHLLIEQKIKTERQLVTLISVRLYLARILVKNGLCRNVERQPKHGASSIEAINGQTGRAFHKTGFYVSRKMLRRGDRDATGGRNVIANFYLSRKPT